MSHPADNRALEGLLFSVIRALAGSGEAHGAEAIARKARAYLGEDAVNEVWYDLYGRMLFPEQ